MAELRLDYLQNKVFPWGGVVMLVLALGALAATWVYYHDLDGQAENWESKAAKFERAARQSAPESVTGGRGRETFALEVKRANEVLRQLNLPWEGLFRAVELSGGKDVALLALEPDTEKHSVKISGEAKNMAILLDYIKQLEQREVFGAVYLQSHQILLQDPDKPVRFALLADWKDKP